MRGAARVLMIGMGGLGCPASMALARAGIGTLALADDDDVDLSNLHRQILYAESSVGNPKVDEAAAALLRLAPGLVVERIGSRILPENARALVSGFDAVVEGSDNFATKFMAADACAQEGVAIVHGAAVRWIGTALAVGPRGRPCYRCVFEDIPSGAQAGCNDAGVMGPMVGVVGALMADLAIGLVDGRDVAGSLVTYDGRTDALRRRTVAARPACALCGDTPAITTIDELRYAARLSRP
jgi:molybdopterin/thiamine biosynthesis adenylyltransferase